MSKLPNVVETFLTLVKIDSVSKHEENIRKYLQSELKKLGVKGRVDAKGNLIYCLKGVLATGPTLLFNAHMDTVMPGNGVKPIVLADRITSDGTTVLGADDKAGLAALLEFVQLLKNKKIKYHEIKIIFTVEEELNLRGAKKLSFADCQADYCFVLDSDGNVGEIVTKAPAKDHLDITVFGRAAHAGLAPEEGINAIKIAAEALGKIKSGRIDEETTLNVGQIRGGQATNIVPEKVTIKTEVRSRNEQKLKTQVRSLKEAFRTAAAKYGGNVTIKKTRTYDRVNTADDSAIANLARQASKKMGLPFKASPSGGGSDASVFYNYGIPTIALAIGMEKVHSKQEYITLKNLSLLPDYLIEIVRSAYNPSALL